MVFGGLETTSAHTEKGQKMPKYINLERARFEAERYFQSMDEIKEDLDTLFCMLQTEDVASVRHGRWIMGTGENGLQRGHRECSRCGEIVKYGYSLYGVHNFCNYCGAKMDEEVINGSNGD